MEERKEGSKSGGRDEWRPDRVRTFVFDSSILHSAAKLDTGRAKSKGIGRAKTFTAARRVFLLKDSSTMFGLTGEWRRDSGLWRVEPVAAAAGTATAVAGLSLSLRRRSIYDDHGVGGGEDGGGGGSPL